MKVIYQLIDEGGISRFETFNNIDKFDANAICEILREVHELDEDEMDDIEEQVTTMWSINEHGAVLFSEDEDGVEVIAVVKDF